MIRHIVLMKCKPEATQEQIDEMFAVLEGLQESISGILSFEGGENNSPEGIARGYTHGFTMDFADEQVRAVYLPHPEHEKAKKKMGVVLSDSDDRVLVLDFNIENSDTYEVYQTS